MIKLIGANTALGLALILMGRYMELPSVHLSYALAATGFALFIVTPMAVAAWNDSKKETE